MQIAEIQQTSWHYSTNNFVKFLSQLDFLSSDERLYCFGNFKDDQLNYIITAKADDHYYSRTPDIRYLKIWDVHYRQTMIDLYPFVSHQFEVFPIPLIDPFSSHKLKSMEFNQLNTISIFKDIRSTDTETIYQISTVDVPYEILIELYEIKQLIENSEKYDFEHIPSKGYILTTYH